MELLPAVNLVLLVSGLGFLLGIPSVRMGDSLKLEEEIAYPLVFLGMVPFAVANNYRCAPNCPTFFEQFPYRSAANVCFLLAFVLQLRANAKKIGGGPTHPKNEPYEGGGQTYLWDDEE
ncbi:hypothetical protein [Halorussus aquaticus]|uniref:Uncharacterized protein n=1 Tax=Halorussus aquaticus TaxID=2953748 RepID=A0ABD5Q598_9EURY|nr:hypothetical protein [Halorussus aquaticus]